MAFDTVGGSSVESAGFRMEDSGRVQHVELRPVWLRGTRAFRGLRLMRGWGGGGAGSEWNLLKRSLESQT